MRSLVFPILLFSSISLISEEGFLISSCYSLELCIQQEQPTPEVRGHSREELPTPEARGGDERTYPASKVRGGSREELPHAPMPEARGSAREDQPHVQGAMAAWAQEGLEELLHIQGQEGRG